VLALAGVAGDLDVREAHADVCHAFDVILVAIREEHTGHRGVTHPS
jgi:hypothetical protein